MLSQILIKKFIAKKQNFINCKNNNKQEDLTKIKNFKFKKQITKAINKRRNIFRDI